jgi:DNA adenine methylase
MRKEAQLKVANNYLKPIMKWAGGKSQLLNELIPRLPVHYGRYIEPFFGGGAFFFALRPERALISDSNPELINMYKEVANNVDQVIDRLSQYKNTKEMFYDVRAQDWKSLSPSEAAARTLYLNKTCYNGLYRVNKKGQFNTPYGRYKNPTMCDEKHLREASKILKTADIVCGDYLSVLEEYAQEGDFIYLDPPYIPVTEYSDFKRYTKEQFYEVDQRNLADEVKKLYKKGCYILLTNSNHPLVYELYGDFQIDVIKTRRSISSKGTKRNGEDIIVTAFPPQKEEKFPDQIEKYPATRFMGSKRKLLKDIWTVASRFEFNSVLDLFSGSGIVSYMFKCQGKAVTSNDYMAMAATFSKAMIENNRVTLSQEEAEALLHDTNDSDGFVSNTFKGLYYSDEDNHLIDVIRANIKKLENEYSRAIAMSALIRACTKKRPRGIFTYTGNRYNDGRRDLQISLKQQFLEAVDAINKAVFDNGKQNKSITCDAMLVDGQNPDLIYIDPPYYSPLSDNEYVRRYHFVEGLARDWKGVEIQQNTKTKKFKSYPTPFSKKDTAYEAFEQLFQKYKRSILLVSYSSNSLPTQDEMIEIMKKYKEHVEVIPIDYVYGFGNQKTAKTHRNSVQEFLFLGY